ncbi:MAG: OFA family MFS transporter [Verrucomicrobiota bacterium]|nr:MAG: OFA family MFS transporter [Verrucomicrobiota bacterium]
MTDTPHTPANRGWIVTFAGLGINLALGVLYAWSMFKDAITREFGWSGSQLNDPYTVCCLVFAAAMVFAGRCQDKLGPRLTATIGGVLIGAGMILISQSNSYGMWMLGFGVLGGLGMGFGYSSATPPALKWFPPAKTGLIAGLVVAGFGLAPVYLAPLSKYLVTNFQLQKSMLILGVAFLVAIVLLSQLLKNPPAGYVAASAGAGSKPAATGLAPAEIIRTPSFWILWLIYFAGAGAGLMVISSISGMAKTTMKESAFIAVAVMAIGNAGGRIAAGLLSDKIGRRWTLLLVLLFQAALMFAAIPVTKSTDGAKYVIVLVATLIGFNYGANLSLFPSFAKDLWGLKNFGMNYGILFTAWGAGSLLSSVAQRLKASSGNFDSSFQTAAALLIAGAALTFLIKPPQANRA